MNPSKNEISGSQLNDALHETNTSKRYSLQDIKYMKNGETSESCNLPNIASNQNRKFSLDQLTAPKIKYSYVPSKVKLYIQQRKSSESKHFNSLGEHLKGSDKNDQMTKNDISPDIYLCNSIFNENELIKLLPHKQKLKGIDGPSSCNFTETLNPESEKTKSEEYERTINALQFEYSTLLKKYAEAENTIDKLRFYKYYYDNNRERSNFSPISSGFRKCHSASNLYHNEAKLQPCPLSGSSSNLFPRSSTPFYDENYKGNSDIGFENNSVIHSDSQTTMLLDSDSSKLLKYIYEKLKEYTILEANEVLNSEEKYIIWKYIVNKWMELVNTNSFFQENGGIIQHDIANLGKVIEGLIDKYWNENGREKQILIKEIRKALSGVDTPVSKHSWMEENSCDSLLSSNLQTKRTSHSGGNLSGLKEGDSGCPPSEHSFDIAPFTAEELVTPERNSISPCSNSHSLTLSQIQIEPENFFKASCKPKNEEGRKSSLKSVKLHRKYKKICGYDECDASASSNDDSDGEDTVKKFKKKKLKAPYKCHDSGRFEEKYRIRTNIQESPLQKRKNYLDMKKLEKSLIHLDIRKQQSDASHKIKTKSKYRNESKSKLINLPLKPSVKESNHALNPSDIYGSSPNLASSSKQINNNSLCPGCSFHSRVASCSTCKSHEICKMPAPPIHDRHQKVSSCASSLYSLQTCQEPERDCFYCDTPRKGQSSTQRKSAAIYQDFPYGRSESVPCLSSSNKEHYCSPTDSINSCRCEQSKLAGDEKMRSLERCNAEGPSKRYIYYGGKHDILGSLDKASAIAEIIKMRSEELLLSVCGDIKSCRKHEV